MSELTIKVETFEGPLDLLLHLIKKMEIDITDIPITEIVAQYMEYLQTMQELELTIAGDYLVMAATLLSIKSSMLLPQKQVEETEEFDEEDPRAELVDMLIEYKRYKEAADSLHYKEQERVQYYTKPTTELTEYQETVPLQTGQVNLFDLLVAFQQVSLRMTLHETEEKTVAREEISIEEKINWIRRKVGSSATPVLFSDLIKGNTKKEIITAFLALLELIKEQEVFVQQQTIYDELALSILQEGGESKNYEK